LAPIPGSPLVAGDACAVRSVRRPRIGLSRRYRPPTLVATPYQRATTETPVRPAGRTARWPPEAATHLAATRGEPEPSKETQHDPFTGPERHYLLGGDRRLARIATVGADGTPHVTPVGFMLTCGDTVIEVGGADLTHTKKIRVSCRWSG
jgi:hypothetical protein